MSQRVIHFEIQADDTDRAKAFYEKTFGWKVEKLMDAKEGGMDYWGLKTGEEGEPGINGGMYRRPAEGRINTFDCTISVDDIDQTIEAVKANGGKVRREKQDLPGVGTLAACTDTEGNIFGILQPEKPD